MRSICIRLVFAASTSVIAVLSVFGISGNLMAGRAPFGRPELVLEATAGDGPGQIGAIFAEHWVWPRDFAVDKDGDIWIMDVINQRVQKFNAEGVFLLQFGGDSQSSPVSLFGCGYIAVDGRGNVVVGPVSQGEETLLIVLNSEGEYLRHFAVPSPPTTIFDFGITAAGEILYTLGGILTVLDLHGRVLYALPDMPYILGRNVSPYSPVIAGRSKKPDHRQVIQKYTGDLRENRKAEVNLAEQGPPGSIRAVGRQILQCDRDGNMFVLSVLTRDPRLENVSFHAPDGRYIQTLPDCPKFSTAHARYEIDIFFTTDARGNLYQMEITPPEGVEVIPNKPVKGGEPFLRIWKWQRQDGAGQQR